MICCLTNGDKKTRRYINRVTLYLLYLTFLNPFETACSRRDKVPIVTYRWPRYDGFVGNKSLDKLSFACSFKLPRYFLFFLVVHRRPLLQACQLVVPSMFTSLHLMRANSFPLEILKCHKCSRNAIR